MLSSPCGLKPPFFQIYLLRFLLVQVCGEIRNFINTIKCIKIFNTSMNCGRLSTKKNNYHCDSIHMTHNLYRIHLDKILWLHSEYGQHNLLNNNTSYFEACFNTTDCNFSPILENTVGEKVRQPIVFCGQNCKCPFF